MSTTSTGTKVPTKSTATPLAHGLQGPRSAIPWAAVRRGWVLAEWRPAPTARPKGSASLFLVDPQGGRYLVTSSAPADESLAAWSPRARIALMANSYGSPTSTAITGIDLVDGTKLYQRKLTGSGFSVAAVSGDGQRVLLSAAVVNTTQDDVVEIDLASGANLHQFFVSQQATVAYTLPVGLAIAVNTSSQLRRVAPDGTTELAFPKSFSTVGGYDGAFLYTADGTEIVMAAARGLALLRNSGSVVRQLPVRVTAQAGQSPGCQPLQWWSAGIVLASCSAKSGFVYWLVPLSRAAPTELAAVGPVFGNLYRVGGGVFAESGACGTTWVDKLRANGKWATVAIPGLRPSESIVGTTATDLDILGQSGCDVAPGHAPPAFRLVSFDPVSRMSTFLLGPSVNGGTVLDALGYPRSSAASLLNNFGEFSG
jgi:hypothetical protein